MKSIRQAVTDDMMAVLDEMGWLLVLQWNKEIKNLCHVHYEMRTATRS